MVLKSSKSILYWHQTKNIYHEYCLFLFFLVKTSKTAVFHWIFVQDENIRFPTVLKLIYMNLIFIKVCIGYFVVGCWWNVFLMYSYICLSLLHVFWLLEKNIPQLKSTFIEKNLKHLPLCNIFQILRKLS